MMGSGWHVLYERPLERWKQNERPSSERVIGLLNWMLDCVEHGPPTEADGAVPVLMEEEPLYVYRVPVVEAVVTYQALVPERLMLVKDTSGRY